MTSVVKPSGMLSVTREHLAIWHAGFVVVASAWLLGGLGPHGEWIVAALASPAYALLFAEARARHRVGDRTGVRRLLRWCAPLVALAALVIVSSINPSLQPVTISERVVLRPVFHLEWLPSSANPAGSLRVLACFTSLAVCGLALAFCVNSRRAVRALLLVFALNGLALSVLGTLQRQSGAAGPFFGFVTAANERWFATFHYYNHWGAFAVLSCAATLGLVFYSLRNPPDRGWFHGPGPLLAILALLICATGPLSASRSATVLLGLLAFAALVAAFRHVLEHEPADSSRTRRSPRGFSRRARSGVLLLAAAALGAALMYWQSGDGLAGRVGQTLEQFSQLGQTDTLSSGYGRPQLYADTWRMASDAPVFGWGLESYGRVFLRYSTFRPGPDRLMNTYEDAHSDWLQALAELGFVGTGLLLLTVLIPLIDITRGAAARPPTFARWALAGCALVAAYAWVEFPFAAPAVVAAWWVLFFASVRATQLSPGGSA